MLAARASAVSWTSRATDLLVAFFADRRRREDRFLEWKVWIFSIAAAWVLIGLYLDDRRITGVALLLLIGAMGLKFLPRGRSEAEGDDEVGGATDAGLSEADHRDG